MTVPPARALEVEGRTVRYGDRTAVRSVSLHVRAGEVVGLAGPNGSGKSSLIRSIATTVPNASGSVRVRGRSLQGLTPLERAREVAWMPQEEPPGDNVPLEDYVAYGRYAYGSRWHASAAEDRAVVSTVLREVDLDAFASRGVRELSGGERQRARLARALAQDAPVVLLDEPTAHLDVSHQLDVLEHVRDHARRHGRAVLMAIHDLNLAARYADRVVVLSRGHVRTAGPPQEVLSSELLAEVWGVTAEMRRDPRSGLPYLIPRLFGAESVPRVPGDRTFRVHVVAGGGSGGALFRAALDQGWEVSAGVLPLFDSDSELAQELGLLAAVEVPFAPIGPEALLRLDELLERADALVVAAFPVGPSNLANLEHLEGWVHRRPTLLIDPAEGAPWDYTGGRAEAARRRLLTEGAERTTTVEGAVGWLAARLARPGPVAPPSAPSG